MTKTPETRALEVKLQRHAMTVRAQSAPNHTDCPCGESPQHTTRVHPWALIAEMRAWVADCSWADDTSDLTDVQVIRGIARHYAGGVAQFVTDASGFPTEPPERAWSNEPR